VTGALLMPPADAVIVMGEFVVLPAVAVTTPPETVAMAVLLEVQVATLVIS